MRNLSFSPFNAHAYERIHTSLLLSPLQLRDRTMQKIHGKTLDKLEAIGVTKPATDEQGKERPYRPDDVRLYMLPAGFLGATVVLEDAEWELAKQACDAAIPVTHKALSRELENAIAFLEGLPEVKPEPVTPPAAATA